VKRFVPEAVWIERGEADTAVARAVQARFPGRVELFDGRPPVHVTSVREGKRALVLQRHRGSFLRHCPAGTSGLVCCNYLVVNLASNCPMDCSYCFLQDYLADTPALAAYSNVDEALRVRHRFAPTGRLPHRNRRAERQFGARPFTELARAGTFFAARRNAVLS
jgi:hypothetical protein